MCCAARTGMNCQLWCTWNGMARSCSSAHRRRFVIFLLYAIFYVPLWVVLPAQNEYIIARRCLSLHGIFSSTGKLCGGKDVSASAQTWLLWVNLACNIPTLSVCFHLGFLADRIGRRPVLIWCLLTQLFGSAGMLIVCLCKLNLAWMMPPYVINGLGGGSFTLQSILMASLADTAVTELQRSVLLARATAMFYACGTIGPLVGGYITQAELVPLPWLHGDRYQLAYLTFFVTNALLLVVAVVAFAETLPAAIPLLSSRVASLSEGRDRNDARWQGLCKVALYDCLQPLRSRAVLAVSSSFMLLYATINTALSGLIVTYAKLSMFGMSDAAVGWFLAVPWLMRSLSAALVFPMLLSLVSSMAARTQPTRSEPPPRAAAEAAARAPRGSSLEGAPPARAGHAARVASLWCVRIGAAISVLTFGCFGWAVSVPALFALCTAEGLASMWDAGCAVLLSSLAEKWSVDAAGAVQPHLHTSSQGAFMGLRGLLQIASAICASLAFNGIYVATVEWCQPFVFYVLSACCAAGLSITWAVREGDL
ncbi:unnamed protein product [Prorocentrum cordatum]|uniref:Solute carrier family 40 protein n=1 Tax=Prorocentrum cordatum TaxID=2364126 RepID=A0ABN9VI18_9DINO|nr:unnamed protein product [Polarella glacialis]